MHGYISSLTTPALSGSGPRSLAILGSTGSIGRSALRVIQSHPDRFEIMGLACATNVELLADQARRCRPRALAVLDSGSAERLKALLPPGYRPDILVGESGYAAMASMPEASMVLNAQVGAAGLPATLSAVTSGKIVALANKESLVLAGPLIRKLAWDHQAVILPVDSEHNAVFQALCGHESSSLSTIILTASGGPFRGLEASDLALVTPKQALAHPNWSMGAKISVDSATLMNKGLEFIEACHLFGVAPQQVEVVVHPESIVHSLVKYQDGSFLAHLGIPDMQIPIAYCLGYPDRLKLDLESLDLISLGKLTFEAPDVKSFPCLDLARQALESGPSYPVVLNAANEVAVDLFLKEKAGFQDIPGIISRALETHRPVKRLDLESIVHVDGETRRAILASMSA